MTSINLLPWRKLRRFQVKKKRLLYAFAGAISFGAIVFLIHYYCTPLAHRQVISNSIANPADQDVYRKQLKNFQDNFRNTSAKLAHQSLDSLHYIGSITDGRKSWALMGQSDGLVSSVMSGDYLGKEHGLVVSIKKNVIEIEKTTWSKRGIEKKSILLPLR